MSRDREDFSNNYSIGSRDLGRERRCRFKEKSCWASDQFQEEDEAAPAHPTWNFVVTVFLSGGSPS